MEDSSTVFNPKGGRPKKSDQKKRKHVKYVYLNDDELKLVNEEKAKYDLSISQFFIQKALTKGTVKTEKKTIDYKEWKSELNRVGVNINQIARNVNSKNVAFLNHDDAKVFKELIEILIDFKSKL
jgi:hypothetical protein